jgi:hypothetical protein
MGGPLKFGRWAKLQINAILSLYQAGLAATDGTEGENAACFVTAYHKRIIPASGADVGWDGGRLQLPLTQSLTCCQDPGHQLLVKQHLTRPGSNGG